MQFAGAKATLLIDSAHLNAHGTAAEIDDYAARGEYPQHDTRARMRG